MSNLRLSTKLEPWQCEQCGTGFHQGQSIEYGFYCNDCAPIIQRSIAIAEMCNDAMGVVYDNEVLKKQFSEVSFADLDKVPTDS
jgi:hypothetical protein